MNVDAVSPRPDIHHDRTHTSSMRPIDSATHDRAADGMIMDCRIQKLFYGNFLAVRDTDLPIIPNEITSFIGPSG